MLSGEDEKYKHIITYVKPVCEADQITRTVAAYKTKILRGNRAPGMDEVSCYNIIIKCNIDQI